MLDEQLIHEVQNHAVIYNRQKYFINSSDPKKYLSKEDAWQEIAIKLNSDVDTCKKRWKYLRERYVQQRKQGDTPNYEHLSRPYLDKMKFLDKHIQPRKSYKQVTSFLPSPNGSFPEFMDSSRSNGSLGNAGYHNNYHENSYIKEEPQSSSFQNFTTDLSSSSHQMTQNSQQQQQQHQNIKAHHQQQQSTRDFLSAAAAVAAAAAAVASSTNDTSPKRHNSNNTNNNNNNNNSSSSMNGNNFRNGEMCHIPCPPSSSSSLKSVKSPLSSPQAITEQNNDIDLKRPRIDMRSTAINNHHDDSSDNNDENDADDADDDDIDNKRNSILPNLANNIHNLNGRLLHNSNHHNDLFAIFHQQFTQHHQQQHATAAAAALNPIKCSEQLLGELVTSELLKMTKERQKIVQRKILEILFFDD